MKRETEVVAERIKKSAETGHPAEGSLQTNERIIGRVTDGIYREPWSAFRELISNAYDADATRVRIDSDFPFFKEIRISDNGNGMDETAVADLLTNIGGSSKRTSRGVVVGTANPEDPRRSPSGRKLIGKIGIGLFAVAQLTQHFQIITKRKGSNKRVSATIKLNTYQEDLLVEQDEGSYVSGAFRVLSEQVDDETAHGTTIILMDIRPAVREKLQSQEIWQALDDSASDQSLGLIDIVKPPRFHIGRVDRDGIMVDAPQLPWSEGSEPIVKFRDLFRAATRISDNPSDRADLSHFDNYFKMVWRLSLGSPLPYLECHPFDIEGGSGIDFYRLSNVRRGSAEKVSLRPHQSIRSALNLESGSDDPSGGFSVFIDGIELRRPIELPQKVANSSSIANPLLFIGKVSSAFSGVPSERSGGKLSFEAYLYWNSKITPKDSIGALIRINGASGSLFDPDFLGYQVSEQTRKKQVTAEIYVTEGLDSALNIDRESFNTSHPHYVFVQKWLHSAFRQFATQHKKLGSLLRDQQRSARIAATETKVSKYAESVWERMRGTSEQFPAIEKSAVRDAVVPTEVSGIVLDWSDPRLSQPVKTEVGKLDALTVVLNAYGVLDGLDEKARANLIFDIISIFEGDA